MPLAKDSGHSELARISGHLSQVVWGQIEHEGHLHHVDRGAGLQDGTEHVRADQEGFVLP